MAEKIAMPTSATAKTRLEYEDFLLFPDDGKRREIIDGVHYVTPSPRLIHQQLWGACFSQLRRSWRIVKHSGRCSCDRSIRSSRRGISSAQSACHVVF